MAPRPPHVCPAPIPPTVARLAAPARSQSAGRRTATSQAQRDVFNRRRQHVRLHQPVEAHGRAPQALSRHLVFVRDYRRQASVTSDLCSRLSVHRPALRAEVLRGLQQ